MVIIIRNGNENNKEQIAMYGMIGSSTSDQGGSVNIYIEKMAFAKQIFMIGK